MMLGKGDRPILNGLSSQGALEDLCEEMHVGEGELSPGERTAAPPS